MKTDPPSDLIFVMKLTAHHDRNGRTYYRGLRQRLSIKEQLRISEALDRTDVVALVLPLDDTTYALHLTRHKLGAAPRAALGRADSRGDPLAGTPEAETCPSPVDRLPARPKEADTRPAADPAEPARAVNLEETR